MKNISFLSEYFQFLEAKFSIYLNRHVFIMDFCRQEFVLLVFETLQKEQLLKERIYPVRICSQRDQIFPLKSSPQ